MKLYYAESPSPRKACAVARHLNAPVEMVPVDLAAQEHKSPDFLAINPNGKVPVLVDGDVQLWESNAIMCYIAMRMESDLWPQDDRQIDVVRWLNWEAAHFSRHAGALYFQNFIKPSFGIGSPAPVVVEEATAFFLQFAGVLDDHLRSRSHLVGDALTIADFAVAATLPTANVARLPLAGFANIDRWHGALDELPAWRDPFPAQLARTA